MDQPTHKDCRACGATKPLDQFNKHKVGKYGHRSRCRECEALEGKAYREANPRSRRQRTPEKYSPEHYQRHRETILRNTARRRVERSQRTDEQIAADRARTRPDGTKRCGKCREVLPLTEFYSNRALMDGLTPRCRECLATKMYGGPKLFAHWESVGIDPRSCSYCSCALSLPGETSSVAPRVTVDHVVPQSRGGSSEWSNLAPACQSCNSSKGNRDLNEWLQSRNLVA